MESESFHVEVSQIKREADAMMNEEEQKPLIEDIAEDSDSYEGEGHVTQIKEEDDTMDMTNGKEQRPLPEDTGVDSESNEGEDNVRQIKQEDDTMDTDDEEEADPVDSVSSEGESFHVQVDQIKKEVDDMLDEEEEPSSIEEPEEDESYDEESIQVEVNQIKQEDYDELSDEEEEEEEEYKPSSEESDEDSEPSDREVSKKARDATMPKQPGTAYNNFMAEQREKVKAKKGRNQLKAWSGKWRKMTEEEKKPYKDRWTAENKKYKEAMEEWKKTSQLTTVEKKSKKKTKSKKKDKSSKPLKQPTIERPPKRGLSPVTESSHESGASPKKKQPRHNHIEGENHKSKGLAVVSPTQVLSIAEEDKLTTWVVAMADRGFPVSSESLRITVQNFLKQDRNNPFTDDKPTQSWYEAFVRRNVKVKAVSNMTRARNLKSVDAVLNGWYAELKSFLSTQQISDKPERLWHFIAIDLTITTGQIPSSNVEMGPLIKKKDTICTCIVCGNAAGKVIPPLFVFKGHCPPTTWDPLVGAPLLSGQLFMSNENGCKDMYKYWLDNHFLPNINTDRPIALLLDSPEGDIDIDMFLMAEQSDVQLFRILPAIVDLVSPISEYMIKSGWEEETAEWNENNPLVPVSIKNVAGIVGKAWPKLTQPEAIVSNFKRVGVSPVDEHVVEKLLLDKEKRQREDEEAKKNNDLKSTQAIANLKLFESKLDRETMDRYHSFLLSKKNVAENDEYMEWRLLYDQVYGKIMMVHNVSLAEEKEALVVVDESQGVRNSAAANPAVVPLKIEFNPSEVVLSADQSTVARDVISEAITMATDTYSMEAVNSSQESQVVNTAPPQLTKGRNVEMVSKDIVHDEDEFATSVDILVNTPATAPSSTAVSASTGALPSEPCSRITETNQPAPNAKVDSMPNSASKNTVVNVIQINQGEKGSMTPASIAIKEEPLTSAVPVNNITRISEQAEDSAQLERSVKVEASELTESPSERVEMTECESATITPEPAVRIKIEPGVEVTVANAASDGTVQRVDLDLETTSPKQVTSQENGEHERELAANQEVPIRTADNSLDAGQPIVVQLVVKDEPISDAEDESQEDKETSLPRAVNSAVTEEDNREVSESSSNSIVQIKTE